jgi:uncharacterized coiled-coil protein SlyX
MMRRMTEEDMVKDYKALLQSISLESDLATYLERIDELVARDAAQRATIQQLEARVKDMEDRLFRHKEMDNPPCFCCGYNGPLYYQPSVHACAARHHKCNQDNP